MHSVFTTGSIRKKPRSEARLFGRTSSGRLFLAELEKGSIRPLPNNFLLVENPFVQEAWDLDNRLFDLNVKGYRPVLAHPERYTYYFPHPERYEQIHAAGTLFQVNLLSLAGYYGKEIKRVAEILVEKTLWIYRYRYA